MHTCVYWAHLDPEASWCDSNNLSLPTPLGAKSTLQLALLDDMFVPANDYDIALTIVPKCPALHDYHASLGARYLTRSVFESLDAWQLAGTPAWPDIFASMQTSGEEAVAFSAVQDILSSSIQSSYAYLAGAPASGEHPTPELSAIRYANSKSTITQLCHQLEIPGLGVVIEQQDDINRLLELDCPFVLKEAFGVSGKGAYLVKEQRITERLVRHFQKQSASGKYGGLVAQPWLDIEIDFSSQWHIDKQGEITFIGLCQVENKGFRFSGIDLCCQALCDVVAQSNYDTHVRRLLSELFKRGYFGPVCVDSALLQDGTVYAVIEVNARESMGSIALRWQEKLSLSNAVRLRQYDVHYQSPLKLEVMLNKLAARGALLKSGQLGGIVPLTASSLALSPQSSLAKGRWIQLECASRSSDYYRTILQSCLLEMGASLQ
ncbi:hypothetical protein N474_08015 [Pseudoalteromonas luteoviolacea CPMOR-2]|uniref:ATP-grasp domain-containing protein n=1 Tax=Pseudoalteromonas luteoviolacea DSM 6061 TaxID=1365250 RepID=A0A166YTI0_9GAMM|nr:hypothetical protein [Pseudoalteromonas luteoviolacea]KZN43505.1 hypothetical protein N475_08870 [Pseudoalteromonas luteoviolacea DSM 6061]KZN57345.1 hypothetical protein N474_08015 [Pseudoalteromonas luteoviolacea CPMOR-2]MBE0388062.1 hypothetical protein [Pseudoalteromonas luteoviolacea DSM 6061]